VKRIVALPFTYSNVGRARAPCVISLELQSLSWRKLHEFVLGNAHLSTDIAARQLNAVPLNSSSVQQ
jgi:hypothetical protein